MAINTFVSLVLFNNDTIIAPIFAQNVCPHEDKQKRRFSVIL